MTDAFVQTVMALTLVLLLMGVFAFLYRKRTRTAGLISVVAYHSLGQKMGIAALKVGKEVLIIGITPTDFKLLKKMDENCCDDPKVSSVRPEGARAKAMPEGKRPHALPRGISARLERLRRMKERLDG